MRTETITCDHCGRDLTSTTNSVGFRLALIVEKLEVDASCSYVTGLGVMPPLESDKHFCGKGCLFKWGKAKTPGD